LDCYGRIDAKLKGEAVIADIGEKLSDIVARAADVDVVEGD
jgi:hypothetical protein